MIGGSEYRKFKRATLEFMDLLEDDSRNQELQEEYRTKCAREHFELSQKIIKYDQEFF